jgi:predicted SnoaL-like aldol condensation-catalyzing enzyme
MNREHPNIEVLKRLDLTNMAASAEVIAEDFVWHYFNTELPEMQGDYSGIEGFADFFRKMAGTTGGTFKVNLISATPMGDELVVTHVKDTMYLKGQQMEIDAVVVWSIVEGKIKEAWDIPAVHKVKVLES